MKVGDKVILVRYTLTTDIDVDIYTRGEITHTNIHLPGINCTTIIKRMDGSLLAVDEENLIIDPHYREEKINKLLNGGLL